MSLEKTACKPMFIFGYFAYVSGLSIPRAIHRGLAKEQENMAAWLEGWHECRKAKQNMIQKKCR